MEQSILKSTKKVLHIAPDDSTFDLDIATHINSAFSTLNDIGVGPVDGFSIEDEVPTWEDFLPGAENQTQRNQVKTFVFLTARLGFDPPASSYLLDATKKQLEEITWRLNVRREKLDWVDPTLGELLL